MSDEIIYSNIQTKALTCGIKPVNWSDTPHDLTLPPGSHCGTVSRCLTTTITSNDYLWRWTQDFGDAGGCSCTSFDCPTSSETCDDSNYGKWLVSFCTY